MKDIITSLISAGDYQKSLDFYSLQPLASNFKIRLLKKGKDSFNIKMLNDELKKIMDSIPEDSQKTTELHSADEKEKEILYLDSLWKPEFKKANYIFSQLDHINDPEERKETAFKILNLMDAVQEIWYQKDFYLQHGTKPSFPVPKDLGLSPAQAATRLRTVRTYISKARKGILDHSKIPDWENEILELNKLLQ
jgi:hypothetical protein